MTITSPPPGKAIGVKETLTAYLERWGICRVALRRTEEARDQINACMK